MVGGAGAAVHVPFPEDPLENSGKKCSFYVRGVAKMEILTLMLRESFLLLMQRHAQYIDSCNASAVKRSKKNVRVTLEVSSFVKKRFPCSVRITFFMLLMERGKHIFEIDLTPTVILTFFKGG